MITLDSAKGESDYRQGVDGEKHKEAHFLGTQYGDRQSHLIGARTGYKALWETEKGLVDVNDKDATATNKHLN